MTATMLETFRRTVDPSDCDFLGHMNVSRYLQACSDAMFAVQAEIGMTRADMANGRRLSFAVVNANSDFRREVMAGEVIFMTTAVEAIGGKSATFRHRLHSAEDGALVFQSIFKSVCLHLVERRGVGIPDDIRAGLTRLMQGESADAD